MRKLPNDVCRCRDDGCPERERCLRWLQRDDVGDRTPQAASLFPYDVPLGSPCTSRIPSEDPK